MAIYAVMELTPAHGSFGMVVNSTMNSNSYQTRLELETWCLSSPIPQPTTIYYVAHGI